MRLDRLYSRITTHGQGIEVGRNQLIYYVPLYWDSETESVSTQYTPYCNVLEESGLVVFDIFDNLVTRKVLNIGTEKDL